MTANVRAIVERLAEVLPGRSTLFVNVESVAEVGQLFDELVGARGAVPSSTRPPHAKSNEDRIWIGADVQVGKVTVLLSSPHLTVPIVVGREAR
jgi:hypothetical protein